MASFHKQIFLFGLVSCCHFLHEVLTYSVSDFKVENITVGSNVDFLCVLEKTSMSTIFRYGSNPASVTGNLSMLAYYVGRKFHVVHKTDRRITVDNSSRIVLNNVTVEDSGFYQCRIQYRSGEQVEKNVHMRIGVAPTIEPLSDMEVLEETSLKVVCNTQGLPLPDVVWFHTSVGEVRVVATSHVLVLKRIQVLQNGAYHCRAKNYMGQAEQSLQIKVFQKPSVREFYHVRALNDVVSQCTNVTLICEMAPNPSSHRLRVCYYRLYQNGRLITKQKNSGMFRISRVVLESDGIYACVPETRLGLGRNKTLRLRVKAAPKLCNDIPTTSFHLSRNASSTTKPLSFTESNQYGRSGSSKANVGLKLNLAFILIFLCLFIGSDLIV